jgi:hypothetical protein
MANSKRSREQQARREEKRQKAAAAEQRLGGSDDQAAVDELNDRDRMYIRRSMHEARTARL